MTASRVSRGQHLRFYISVMLILGMFMVVGWRISSLHLHPNAPALERMKAATEFETEIRGERGTIRDASGNILAMDIACHHVSVDPHYMAVKGCNPKAVQARLAYFLDLDKQESEDLGTILSDTNRKYAVVKKFVDFRVGSRIRSVMKKQGIYGVMVEDAYLRRYPKDEMLAQVIGFANSDGLGISGVESLMERYLRGESGLRVGRMNAKRKEMYTERVLDVPARSGSDVYLTINMFIQEAIEEALAEAMSTYRPLGAWAVLLDTESGAILGMASKPDFDPNKGGGFFGNAENQRNRCLAYGFEPGSVLKPLSVSAALNEGRISRGSHLYCEEGYWLHEGKVLRDSSRRFGNLSIDQVLMKSSNIGTAKAVMTMSRDPRTGAFDMREGMKTLQQYYHDFGLGQASPLGLPGEEACPMSHYSSWYPIRLSRVAIGQGIRVNAIQLAGAINAIANDGKLMQPYLIDRVVSPDGTQSFEAVPKVIRQVIRKEIAAQMRGIMSNVVMSDVEDCTGHKARVEGYDTAGKTGTAQKWINGSYSNTRNISSFVGFVPADKPAFTLVVVLDEPKAPDSERQLGGGSSAALVFRQIAEAAAKTLSVPLRESELHASTSPAWRPSP